VKKKKMRRLIRKARRQFGDDADRVLRAVMEGVYHEHRLAPGYDEDWAGDHEGRRRVLRMLKRELKDRGR
jgi:hypothetical protein